jgi:BirA family transcriptional regulator, biotin operon repressor / biotin---[acetyl-CoA-carboxylase] ligase
MNESVFVKKNTSLLNTLDFVKKAIVFDTVNSTNATARDLAETGAVEGTIVLARTQQQGRGRFTRTWESPEGGLYLSMILRPNLPAEKSSLLSFIAALAAVKTMRGYGIFATIKWPNDVRVNGRKIAGILLESGGKGQRIEYVVVGIGINLAVDLTELSAAIQTKSTTMEHELKQPVDFQEFLKSFIIAFEQTYKDFNRQRFNDLVKEWKSYSDTLGKKIRVSTMTGDVEGTAYDVDSSGFLLLKTQTGETKRILSGDCLYVDELDHT